MDDLLEPDDGAPICSACGVTAMPGDDGEFVCDNPDCPVYGDAV